MFSNGYLSTSTTENIECCAGFTNRTGICESKQNIFDSLIVSLC